MRIFSSDKRLITQRGEPVAQAPGKQVQGKNRGSPPVQQLDVSEYMTASQAGSERGRRRHRGCQGDRPSVGREGVGRSFNRRIESLPGAGRKIPTHQPMQDISLGADALGRTRRQTSSVQACHCHPGDSRSYRFPGEARATTLLREGTADPCRGDLRQTTGRGKRLHQPWDLGWRQFRA